MESSSGGFPCDSGTADPLFLRTSCTGATPFVKLSWLREDNVCRINAPLGDVPAKGKHHFKQVIKLHTAYIHHTLSGTRTQLQPLRLSPYVEALDFGFRIGAS